MDAAAGETILIVDDEESVRQTFREWLAGQGCTLLTAGDAESALKLANEHPVDLAILDWNLGAGDDGLQLLQDLVVFHPDVVAILVTGYANQATPLDAMRMGVRDYLDKNHDLSRDTFLKAVRKQLDRIRPAKRARQLQRSLQEFRAAVEKTLPLVQSAAALTDPVPLPETVRRLVRLAVQLTRAKDGVLLVRHYDAERTPAEWSKAYDAAGNEAATGSTPFARSLAGAALSRQEACVMSLANATGVTLYPFEEGRGSVLVAPMVIGTGVQAVLELFDKAGGFTSDDQRLAQAAAELGAELVRHALGQKSQQQMLFDALGAALGASDRIARTLDGDGPRSEEPPPPQVLDQLRQGLTTAAGDPAVAKASVELAEAIRVLGVKHGPPALRHCLRLVDDVRALLDGLLSGST
jgi:ActR/RegA family two-component response regulator